MPVPISFLNLRHFAPGRADLGRKFSRADSPKIPLVKNTLNWLQNAPKSRNNRLGFKILPGRLGLKILPGRKFLRAGATSNTGSHRSQNHVFIYFQLIYF